MMPDTFDEYYEPFLGGGALFFHLWKKGMLDSKKSYLSDINFELYNVYKHIQTNPSDLIDFSSNINLSSNEKTYYINRDRFNELRSLNCNSEELIERAVLMMYLNRNAYSGMYRENSKGDFNVPFGYYKDPVTINEDNLWAIHYAFKNVILTHGDYKTVLNHYPPSDDDFVYFDPPYMICQNVSGFNKYNKNLFDESEQMCLFRYYMHLSSLGVKCMLSNSSSDVIKSFFNGVSGISINTINAPRTISRKHDANKLVQEYVITNY